MGYLHKYYAKEEEFIDHYTDIAYAASDHIDQKWKPDADSDESARRFVKLFGDDISPNVYYFDGAAIHHTHSGQFLSAQIILKSSARLVTVKVTRKKDKMHCETIVDKPIE